ncbi:MAG: type II toxin-antitoxin system mRNA interferase toxin, RelE/StbE family [Elusimicrobia bacterium CG06_land_8_20_14_3_00_38_11]|nr:MAG: type II toxin-antitoxin system mRNA interferase toxin, RelE/StbE family [Elusimicrobia bacterium CG06_land_8_20_14_3_00_38_11]
MYEVAYQPEADEDLEKLDKSTRERIIKKIHWLAKYIENIRPEMLGGNYRGVYKLRIGNWRVIYGINHAQKMITVFTIGHRSEIYKT